MRPVIERLAKYALRFFWLVLLPALGASLCLRYALLPPTTPFSGHARGSVVLWLSQHWLWLWALLFVGLALIARYWAPVLPGGHALLVDRARGSAWARARSTGVVLGLAVAAALLIRASVAGIYRVEGSSMLPSLEGGDSLLVDKLAYGLRLPKLGKLSRRAPRRGDVILLRRAVQGEARELLKRVIGLPGDRIRMEGPHPVINGWRVPSCDLGPYTYVQDGVQLIGHASVEYLEDSQYLIAGTLGRSRDAVEFLVGEGEVFVLGDNRSGSSDSRSWGGERGGGVPFDAIDGRASRALVGVMRQGDADLRQLFRSPADFNLHGFDVRPLESALEACLARRPPITRPPANPVGPTRELAARPAQ